MSNVRKIMVLAFIAATTFLGPGAFAEGKKVLMFTKSSGFQHDVVKRGKQNSLGLAEQTVTDLGKKLGFEVTVTKDGSQITADNLKNYQALFFYTQGDLGVPGLDRQPPIKNEDRQAILEFVKNGGGFVGTHCGGADTYHNWIEGDKKPFLEMVGGEFIGHGSQQMAHVEIIDRDFPAFKGWPTQFVLFDEWYAYQGFQPNMHVLAMIRTKGMPEPLYQRNDYPIAWCSNYGKGKVFYTGLGHRDTVWQDPRYRELVGNAVLWVLGQLPGDASPNLKSIFGDEKTALERINPPAKR